MSKKQSNRMPLPHEIKPPAPPAPPLTRAQSWKEAFAARIKERCEWSKSACMVSARASYPEMKELDPVEAADTEISYMEP